MGWETDKLHRTLIIEKRKSKGKTLYHINGMMRVRTDTGQTYMEPIPFQLFVQGTKDIYRFEEIEVVENIGMDRTAKAGDYNLTKMSNADESVRPSA